MTIDTQATRLYLRGLKVFGCLRRSGSVDATQGVEAQNSLKRYACHANANSDIVPQSTRFDLPSARPEEVRAEIAMFLQSQLMMPYAFPARLASIHESR